MALAVLAATFVVLPSAGCRCELECDDRALVTQEVVGTVTNVENGVVTLLVDDRPEPLDVLVYGRASALEVGEDYRVPLRERPPTDVAGDTLREDRPSANLDGSCDCGAPFITHPDGSEVDTGILPNLPLRKYGWAILDAAVIGAVVWAGLRWRAHQPL